MQLFLKRYQAKNEKSRLEDSDHYPFASFLKIAAFQYRIDQEYMSKLRENPEAKS